MHFGALEKILAKELTAADAKGRHAFTRRRDLVGRRSACQAPQGAPVPAGLPTNSVDKPVQKGGSQPRARALLARADRLPIFRADRPLA